jgi:hypothetical protein
MVVKEQDPVRISVFFPMGYLTAIIKHPGCIASSVGMTDELKMA